MMMLVAFLGVFSASQLALLPGWLPLGRVGTAEWSLNCSNMGVQGQPVCI